MANIVEDADHPGDFIFWKKRTVMVVAFLEKSSQTTQAELVIRVVNIHGSGPNYRSLSDEDG